MKIANIFYAAIFFASMYTINSYGALTTSQVISSTWPHAQELHQLIKSGSSEKLKIFFKKHPELINVSISDQYPHPPLSHYLCYRPSCTSEQDICNTIQMLIDLGADVNTIPASELKSNDWHPAIMIATLFYKSVRLLEILFSHSAMCNAQDKNGTILQHLIRRMAVMADKHFLLLIEKALQYGADPYFKSTSLYFENTQKVDCFDVIKKNKEDFSCNIRAYNNHDPDCILGRSDYKNACRTLKYLEQAEKLLKIKYIAPIKIIKTHTKIHLTYIFPSPEN